MLFYGCTSRETEDICRQIQMQFARLPLHQAYCPVSVSIGAARFRAGERPSELLERADQALYRAKQCRGSCDVDADCAV